MSEVSDSGGSQFPVFESEPLYLRLTLVFPYTKGMRFQNAVFGRDGKDGFAEVFKRSPTSTAQILHPQLYFDDVKPGEPDLPDPHLPRGYKPLVGGSLGEAGHLRAARTVPGQGARRRDRPALARLGLRAAGEQEGQAGGAALRRRMG